MSLTNENSLLLSKCSQFNIGFVENAYDWFSDKLHPICTDSLGTALPGRMKDALEKHGPRIIDMLNQADFGISNIIVKKAFEAPTKRLMEFHETAKNLDSEGLSGNPEYYVKREIPSPEGGAERYYMPFDSESNGTKRMVGLIISWIDSLEEGNVLLIDELESGLHPHIVDFLISYFSDRSVNENRAQLIFTTYDATLAKRNGFRRDQVWFTARDPAVGITSLYSWLDYDVRSDVEFAENYLAGRFGAIPDVKKTGK